MKKKFSINASILGVLLAFAALWLGSCKDKATVEPGVSAKCRVASIKVDFFQPNNGQIFSTASANYEYNADLKVTKIASTNAVSSLGIVGNSNETANYLTANKVTITKTGTTTIGGQTTNENSTETVDLNASGYASKSVVQVLNSPSKNETNTYTYNADGRLDKRVLLVMNTTTTTNYTYNGGNLIKEVDNEGTTIEYTYFMDKTNPSTGVGFGDSEGSTSAFYKVGKGSTNLLKSFKTYDAGTPAQFTTANFAYTFNAKNVPTKVMLSFADETGVSEGSVNLTYTLDQCD